MNLFQRSDWACNAKCAFRIQSTKSDVNNKEIKFEFTFDRRRNCKAINILDWSKAVHPRSGYIDDYGTMNFQAIIFSEPLPWI